MAPLSALNKPLLFLMGYFLMFDLQAQTYYTPCDTYSSESHKLISTLRSMLDDEYESVLRMTPSKQHERIREMYNARTRFLVNQVKSKWFVKNDSLERYVNTVFERLTGSNSLGSHRKIVLIARSHEVNAVCYGRGVFVVTVGLLGRIQHESELAFTLAHEIAHDELDHVQTNVLQLAEIDLEKKAKQQVKKIATGEIELEDIEEFRQVVYGISRHNRVKELEADSLGFDIFMRTGFDEPDALSMLSVLQASKEPKHDFGAEVFMPLHAEAFPLQEYFFKDQLSIYSKTDVGNLFLLFTDSVQSHPDMEIRKQKLRTYFQYASDGNNGQSIPFVKAVTRTAEFETVEAAYQSGDFDWCLFHALHLLKIFPDNSYLISRIASVLIKLYEAKNDHVMMFYRYVPRFTSYYSPMAKLVNNMLHNLTAKETAEMAYYFLRNPNHFDANDESHYYLLWRISDLTLRYDVRDEMKNAYKAKFEKNISAFKYPERQ